MSFHFLIDWISEEGVYRASVREYPGFTAKAKDPMAALSAVYDKVQDAVKKEKDLFQNQNPAVEFEASANGLLNYDPPKDLSFSQALKIYADLLIIRPYAISLKGSNQVLKKQLSKVFWGLISLWKELEPERNPEDLLNELRDLYIKKNRDYGGAFRVHGPVGVFVRLGDKLQRLTQEKLFYEGKLDSCKDAINYTILAYMLLDEITALQSHPQPDKTHSAFLHRFGL